jgi:uncharacterized membrane protein (UPF0127 family)
VSAVVFGAQKAIELESGAAVRSNTRVGDSIAFETI